MSTLDFSNINKITAMSFKAQKNMIKNIARGNKIPCETCGQALKLTTPIKGVQGQKTGVFCGRGCTDIELDFA